MSILVSVSSIRLEELRRMHQSLQDTYTAVSSTLSREKALREQLERELGEAHDHIKLLAAGTNKEVSVDKRHFTFCVWCCLTKQT